jgi:hypothetical protein
MTKFQRTWALAAAVMLLGLAGILAFAQKKPAATTVPPAATQKKGIGTEDQASPMLLKLEPAERERVRAAVGKPSQVTIEAIVQEFEGPFDSVGSHMDAFKKELKEQNISPGGKGDNGKKDIGLMIVYSQPNGNTAHLGVGVEVPLGFQGPVKAPLKLEHFAAPQGIHLAPQVDYARLEHLHNAVHEQALKTHKRGTSYPAVVRLLDDPRTVGAGRARYELVEKLQ